MRIAIVGAGEVGATVGYACLLRGVSDKLILCDVDRAKAEAQALDLAHGVQFARMADVWGTDDIGDCAGADAIVLAAGAKQRPGQTRLDLAADNVAMCRSVVPDAVKVAPDAMVLVVTNPVDVVTRAALDVSGLDPARVIGSGTVLDTSRLRRLLSVRCGVAVQNVHAYVVGEHGDSSVALWSSATIGGVPLDRWGPGLGGVPSADERSQMLDDVRRAAYRIVAGKGATSFGIGVMTARIIEAIDHDERRVLPVSSYHESYQGIDDVCLSVPTIVDRTGIVARLVVPLADDEHAGLAASADAIRSTGATVGL
ncbi:MAG TPA: L-lactate dehydrogenase [Acidimicrobiales bacterium]|nr:L-lactate dehydrogenase [Acidimicrobiales bacterium]